jgi:hypothetical protein
MTHRETTDDLIAYSCKIAQAGNIAGARSILRALSRQDADNSRVWYWLSRYAETPAEQHEALERTLQLDPEHQEARSRLQQLQAQVAKLQPVALAAATQHAPKQRQPNRAFVGVAAIAIVALILAIAGATSVIGLSVLFNHQPLFFGSQPDSPPQSSDGFGFFRPTTPLTPTATPRPNPTPLSVGTILEEDGWYIKFVRSTDTQVLTGAVGLLQPRERFVLVLLAVANKAPIARPIPADMLFITDATGNRYTPVDGVSRTYLEVYGRGVHGDVAYGEFIPGGGGMYSVPVVFDIPSDASGLLLTTGRQEPEGWLIPNVINGGGELSPDEAR